MDTTHIVILAALVIGLIYGSVGLLSGFCLMSRLRGWWADGDGRLVRTYALAMGIGIAASPRLAACGLVGLGKSICLRPTLSGPLMVFGRGNLRAFVVVIVLGSVAEMTLKGLIAPARVAMLQAAQTTATVTSLPALVSGAGLHGAAARMMPALAMAAALIIFAFTHGPFRRSPGQVAAGLIVGLLVAAGWFVTGYLGADDFNPAPVTSLTFIAPIADTLQYVMLSTGLTLNFGIATVAGVFAGSFVTALATRRFHWEGFSSPRHMP